MIWLWFACAEHVESVEHTVQVSTTVQEGSSTDCILNEAGTLKLCTRKQTCIQWFGTYSRAGIQPSIEDFDSGHICRRFNRRHHFKWCSPGQGRKEIYGRTAWLQQSDWNHFCISQ